MEARDDRPKLMIRTVRRRTVIGSSKTSTTSTTTLQQKHEEHNDKQQQQHERKNSIINFQVPSTIPSIWLIQNSVTILIKYLVYSRGLLPMTVEQLHSTCCKNNSNETIVPKSTEATLSPSLRRKIRQSYEQICRLFDEWKSVGGGWSSATEMPSFVLISIGPSFSQSRELYVLDIQSLLMTTTPANGEIGATDTPSGSKLESTLARRLLSTLLNDDKNSPLQELPSKSSPSFRLWICLGILTKKEQQNRPMGDSHPLDHLPSWCITRPNGCPQPPRKRHHSRKQRSSSNVVVYINIQKKEKNNDDKTSNNDVFLRHHDVFKSDQITWVSLPTCLKGFRL
jgi:hypothetical protein